MNFPVEAAGQRFQQWLDYDVFGQPGRFIDERGNTTHLTYKPWGPMKKLDQVKTHRAKDGGGMEDQPTTFDYDPMGRPTKVTFPDGTTEENTYQCKDGVTYLCDQVHSFKTRKGQQKTIAYDARGRETSHTWSDNTPGVSRVWDDANRLSSITNSVSTIGYTYDDASQVKTKTDTIVGANGPATTEYRRFGNGMVWNIFYPNGMRVSRNYTPELRLRAMWDHGPVNWQSVINYTYTDDGKVDHADYANGVTTSYGYDGRGMINLVRNAMGASGPELSRRDYYRDERDRIVAFRKGTSTANPMENGRGDRFSYDAEGQLLEAWYNAVDPANSGAGNTRYDVFSYDEIGNRKDWASVASKGWMHYLRRDNGLNQYLSWENNYPNGDPAHWGSGIYHDDNSPWAPYTTPPGNGVTMGDGWLVASYNALNQPIVMIPYQSSNYVWFGYDPLGRCVKRTVGSNPATGTVTYLYYDGWNLIQEGPSAGYADRQYIHGARVDEIVKTINYTAGGQEAYHHYDARGHCTLLTTTSGGILEQYEYDAFGQPYFFNASGTSLTSSPFGNRFLFTGREWLSSLKIYDYRNRMYQPELGRFLQPDPKQFDAGDYNLYRYCHNDPVNKSDPFGLDVNAIPAWDQFNNNAASLRGLYSWHNWESSRIHVFGHGTRGGAMNTAVTPEVYNNAKTINDVPAAMQWTPEQIVAAVQADKNYKPDSIVELDICDGADPGPDGKSLQEKVAALLPPTNTVLASTGSVSPSDGKSKDGTARKSMPGQKKPDKKETK